MNKLLVLIALALIAAGCSGGPDLGSPRSLELVCDGMPHDWAPELDTGELDKVEYMYTTDGESWIWDAFVGDSGSDWAAIGTTETALVVCLDVTSSTEVTVCEYEDGYTESRLANDYDVTLRAASTGEVIDTTSVSVEANTDCGLFILASSDDAKHEDRYASPSDALEDFLRPHVVN